jgi:hypothetical protein
LTLPPKRSSGSTDLLDRVLKKYDRVITAIDDLDKQDPSVARQIKLNIALLG